MSESTERIPFQVDVSRIIEVLARQIYQTPLALLRENTQNAFDAILLRRHLANGFDPRIDIRIDPQEIKISDNGVGMTRDDLRSHFWRAGSSSKNTPEARAAGVVGTFGIGAMANFGIAEALIVETESAISSERTRSTAHRDTLSTTEETIELTTVAPTGEPGTTVVARVPPDQAIDVAGATAYIEEFIAYVDLPVLVNERLLSMNALHDAVPTVETPQLDLASRQLFAGVAADVGIRVARTGEVWVHVTHVTQGGIVIPGELVLRQGVGATRTFRSGFGLASVGVSSHYQFGGVANLTLFEPTAGREALTTESMQFLQSLVSSLDALVSERLAELPEADFSTAFMNWVRKHGRYELCGNLRVRLAPGTERPRLETLRERSQQQPILVYTGADTSIIEASASEERPLVVLANQQPRRGCEEAYLQQFVATELVTDAPTVLSEKPAPTWTPQEQALAFRIVTILESDYFLTAEVGLGKVSHGLPLVVDQTTPKVRLVFDPDGPTFSLVRELYESDYVLFGSMTKDFVRNVVFPRVAELVPSSTRQGAEAFLKSIRRTRDVFEYEWSDLESLSSVWEQYLAGGLTMAEAATRSTYIVQRNVQVVDSSSAQAVRDVVPDVVDSEAVIGPEGGEPDWGPVPAILRTSVLTEAKVLTIDPADAALRGYRCFVAISDRTREERGDFFLQPHSTSVVWSGQKVLFVFEHHSGEFGLYYDLQASQIVAAESGGGPFPSATLVLENAVFIPVPDLVASAFIPIEGERKRFEVRSDLLFTDPPL
jgi:molecular chaperone HtpG